MKTRFIRLLPAVLLLLVNPGTTSGFYDPGLQRWINRDPIGEDALRKSHYNKRAATGVKRSRLRGSDNLYLFARNSPGIWVDRTGLDIWVAQRPFYGFFEHWNINVGDPNGSYKSYSFEGWWGDWFGEIYEDTPGKTMDSFRYLETTPEQDAEATSVLDQMVGDSMHYSLLNNSCRDFSCEMYEFFEEQFPTAYSPFRHPQHNPCDTSGWRGGNL